MRKKLSVILTENHEESCSVVADLVAEVMGQGNVCLGLATGGSMEGVYTELRRRYDSEGLSFRFVATVNLDEYIGLGPSHVQSYRHYMDQKLFNHVDIDKARTCVPRGTLPQAIMLKEFQEFLDSRPRDLQLLGLGSNGHIGFNEPAPFFAPWAHVVTLKEGTRRDNQRFFSSLEEVPSQAVTMGIGDILNTSRIVLLVHGPSKAEPLKALLQDDRVCPEIPCTALKLHPNVVVVVDHGLASLAEVEKKCAGLSTKGIDVERKGRWK